MELIQCTRLIIYKQLLPGLQRHRHYWSHILIPNDYCFLPDYKRQCLSKDERQVSNNLESCMEWMLWFFNVCLSKQKSCGLVREIYYYSLQWMPYVSVVTVNFSTKDSMLQLLYSWFMVFIDVCLSFSATSLWTDVIQYLGIVMISIS